MSENTRVRPDELHRPVLAWYAEHARDLPWRGLGASPWRVMVSEFMLQQTPVARVLPVFEAWMEAWPTPASLADAPSGEAVRAWGRLGYPRRALRLHAAAVAIVAEHNGEVPMTYEDLRSLPGVGDYTASAIASFAFGARHAVLDTNVRRVFARAVGGVEFPAAAVTKVERTLAESLLPPAEGDVDAATWAVAVMELGALVCTANDPKCHVCPIAERCRWRMAGSPAYDGPPRRAQAWAGTDRMVRGRLMAVLRESEGTVTRAQLDAVWPEPVQRGRALQSLLDDGLVVTTQAGRFGLPEVAPSRRFGPTLSPEHGRHP